MDKIEWKNNQEGGTIITWELWYFIKDLYRQGIIPNVHINAKFMNTYHPELLYEEILNGKEKSYEELKEHFKDLWNEREI